MPGDFKMQFGSFLDRALGSKLVSVFFLLGLGLTVSVSPAAAGGARERTKLSEVVGTDQLLAVPSKYPDELKLGSPMKLLCRSREQSEYSDFVGPMLVFKVDRESGRAFLTSIDQVLRYSGDASRPGYSDRTYETYSRGREDFLLKTVTSYKSVVTVSVPSKGNKFSYSLSYKSEKDSAEYERSDLSAGSYYDVVLNKVSGSSLLELSNPSGRYNYYTQTGYNGVDNSKDFREIAQCQLVRVPPQEICNPARDWLRDHPNILPPQKTDSQVTNLTNSENYKKDVNTKKFYEEVLLPICSKLGWR